MYTKTFALAATLVLSFTSVSLAQTPAAGGNTEGNMNNPGSVKSNSEKGMERSTGSATMAPGSVTGTVPSGAAGAGSGTAAPTSGHNSGGGTSSGGMAR